MMRTDADYLKELRDVLGPNACVVAVPQIGMLGCKENLFDETYYVIAGDEESLIRHAREKKRAESVSTTLVFVYGSLKRGFGNHRLLAASRFVSEAVTTPRYELVSLGAFPGMAPGSRTVRGEVYEVDAETLDRLDALEGVAVGFYRRERVELADFVGEVEGYLLNRPAADLPTVPGDPAAWHRPSWPKNFSGEFSENDDFEVDPA